MPFTPPTRDYMKTVLRRSLRDDDGKVFVDALLDDFITEALADLSLFRPAEYFLSVPFDPALYTSAGMDPDLYDLMNYMWMIEYRWPGGLPVVIPFMTGEGLIRNGWNWYADRIVLSTWWFNMLAETHRLHQPEGVTCTLYGYRERHFPDADSDILDLQDSVDYLCVVRHVKSLAFQTLEADRGLYQQWLAATNNTDVSPTQLQGMRNQAEQSYERLRKQSARPRRSPMTTVQYVT